MRVIVDRTRCIGSGSCAATVPEVFDQDQNDGTVVLLDPSPPSKLHEAVRCAATLCPGCAITVEEG